MFKKNKINDTTEIIAEGLLDEKSRDKKHARSLNINWPGVDSVNASLQISRLQKDASEISAVIGSSIKNTVKAREDILKGELHSGNKKTKLPRRKN